MEVTVAGHVKQPAKYFRTVTLEWLWSRLRSFDQTWYEVIHPDKNEFVKPFFDVDDPTRKTKYKTIYDKVIPYLNTIFGSSEEDWALSDDSRKSKSSFHLVLTNRKTTVTDMRKLRDAEREEFKALKIDTSVYSAGYQKFRTLYSIHETDPRSLGLRPHSFGSAMPTDLHHHLVTCVADDLEVWTFPAAEGKNEDSVSAEIG